MEITENLCRCVTNLGYEDIGDAARTAARRLVIDGVAVAVAGSNQEASPGILADHLREMGGAPAASAIGFGF